jgi:glycosyltransferase involved in cell wall biosynthesis
VISTSVAVEGMDLQDDEHVLVADDPAAFAAAVLRVYDDAALWNRLSEAGRTVVSERWAPDVMRARLEALVQHVRARGTPVRARVDRVRAFE